VLAAEDVANESPRRAPTLADVARVAEVSLSTAARVLRDPATKVAPDLVERVRLAARELDYVPNVLARSLRGGTPTMVGLIVGDMLDPYYGAIARP
jgi:LacI family transcriptional regulator